MSIFNKFLVKSVTIALVFLISIFLTLRGLALISMMSIFAIALIVLSPMFFIIVLPVVALIYLPIIGVGQLNVTLTDVILSLIVLSAMIFRFNNNDSNEFKKISIILIVLAFSPLVFGFIGHLSSSGDVTDAIVTSLLFAKRFSMYSLLLLALPLSRKHYLPLFTYILLFCITISSLSAVFPQFNDSLLSPESIQSYGERRVGLLLNPNVAGNYAIIFFNISVSILIYGRNLIKYRLPLASISLILSVILLFLSGSRGAIFAGLASVLFWMWHNGRNKKLFFAISILFLSCVVLIMAFPESSIVVRFATFTNQGAEEMNVAGRLTSQAIALRIFSDYPIFGTGIGSLARLSPSYGANITGADSQYVDTLVETGVFGLLALLYILYKMFNIGFSRKSVFGTALSVNVIAMSVSGFSVFTFYSPFLSIIIWYLVYLSFLESKKVSYEN